jgi:hypothetical protein
MSLTMQHCLTGTGICYPTFPPGRGNDPPTGRGGGGGGGGGGTAIGPIAGSLVSGWGIAQAAATAIAAACVAVFASAQIVDSDTICSGKKLPIFITGGLTTPKSTEHDLEALDLNPTWLFLNRGPNSEDADGNDGFARRDWYRAKPACIEKSADQDCDEFPFYSTVQGGPAFGIYPEGHLKGVLSSDNRSQGSSVGAFYRKCGMTVDSRKRFLVVAVDDIIVPTLGICPRL